MVITPSMVLGVIESLAVILLPTQNMCVFTRGKRIQRANSKTTQKIFSLQNENSMTSLIA